MEEKPSTVTPSTTRTSGKPPITIARIIFDAVMAYIGDHDLPQYPKLNNIGQHNWLLNLPRTAIDEVFAQRFEWLGDKIANLIVGRLLCRIFPSASTYTISKFHSILVSNRVFAAIACKLGMATNPLVKDSANRLEAYVQALFEESEMTEVGPWLIELFSPIITVVGNACISNGISTVHPYYPDAGPVVMPATTEAIATATSFANATAISTAITTFTFAPTAAGTDFPSDGENNNNNNSQKKKKKKKRNKNENKKLYKNTALQTIEPLGSLQPSMGGPSAPHVIAHGTHSYALPEAVTWDSGSDGELESMIFLDGDSDSDEVMQDADHVEGDRIVTEICPAKVVQVFPHAVEVRITKYKLHATVKLPMKDIDEVRQGEGAIDIFWRLHQEDHTGVDATSTPGETISAYERLQQILVGGTVQITMITNLADELPGITMDLARPWEILNS